MIDEEMRVEILKALWPCFRRRGPVRDVIPRLFNWQQAALGAGINLHAAGIKARIGSWWRELEEDEPSWGLLFQMVWDMANQQERAILVDQGRRWLKAHPVAGAWPWINRRLLQYTPSDATLREEALAWLSCNLAHLYYANVWLDLFQTVEHSDRRDTEKDDLLRLALQSIPVQPESNADFLIWEKTATLNPAIDHFAEAITRKLTIVRSPYKLEKAIDFLLRFIEPADFVAKLLPTFATQWMAMVGRSFGFTLLKSSAKMLAGCLLAVIGWQAVRSNQNGITSGR
ncbi:hypothetical protein XI04_03210, partial [Bradyrhizobium sp. CCBAU 11430]|nr:hypothetical protein [Bradyrhizobium sp. CCBAU 11430]